MRSHARAARTLTRPAGRGGRVLGTQDEPVRFAPHSIRRVDEVFAEVPEPLGLPLVDDEHAQGVVHEERIPRLDIERLLSDELFVRGEDARTRREADACGDPVVRAQHDRRDRPVDDAGDGCCRPFDSRTRELETERPARDETAGDVDRPIGNGDVVSPEVDPELDIGAARERLVGLMRVDEQESAVAVGADCPAQRLEVVDVDRRVVGERAVHVGEASAEGGEEGVVVAEEAETRARVAGRADRGLEVVVEPREIVGYSVAWVSCRWSAGLMPPAYM